MSLSSFTLFLFKFLILQFSDLSKDMKQLIFFIFIAISLQQETLPLSTPVTITLESHLSKSYLLQLPEKIEVDQDLFITSVPLLDIPTQIPILTLQSSSFNKSCIYSKNELEGVCTVSNKELAALSNSSLVLAIQCIEACTFVLEAYLNDVVTIAYSTSYKIKPTSDSLAIFQFELPVPQSSFDEVRVEALIEANDDKIEKGVEMYANVGNYGALLPNQDNYQYKAVSVHKGVGINIDKEQLPKGTWIKIALFTNSKLSVTLSAESAVGSTQQLTFGKRKSCFLAKDKQKSFIIDLTSSISQILEKDINLMITIYSGFPEVKVSFDPSYQQIIENYGVGGNLNYLFTSKFRKEGNFTGKIYLNAKSEAQSYFQIVTSINPKGYIYMQESSTYISQLQPLSLANYIFDSYYDLPKGHNTSDYLYFTIKLKALLGEGYFACRMCNQQSIFKCLLNNSSQLSDKDFANDVQNLPGNILIYYSLYQIFLYSQVQQCRIVGSDSLSTRYLCRIHIVSYNFNTASNLEWALTAYTRQKSIILSQGNPFKDMVYEDSYNYYSFTIPPNVNAVDVFLTVLSGEAKLVTSQYYFFPELLFANIDGNDIKVHLNNHNTYSGEQLKGQIYIGVYGKGVAEYVVNVVVRRNETNALVSLIPQMQQFFQIAKGAAMKFKLTMGSEGPSIVEIIELFGSVSTLLTNKTVFSPICSEFLKCSFQATTKEELILSVKATEYARISINYYPQQSCRMFSMGIASFIQIDPNTTECASFLINPDKDLQISYSENILHSLSTNLLVSLEIGQHSLGKLESHQLLMTKQQLNAFCKSANNTQSRTCTLQLTIVGDLQSKVELQFSVIDHQSPVPIYDGMTIPFIRRPFKKDTPAYFYYYSLSTKTPTVFIRSFNYQTYIVAFKWVNYTTFLNSSSTQIYPTLPSRIDYKTSFDLSLYYRHLQAKPSIPVQCSECLLLVSIFAYQDYKEGALELEIVREEGYIEIGETVRGTLSKQDFLAYQLQKGDNKGKNIITLHNYKEGQGCYRVVLEQSSKQQISFTGNEIIIPNPNKTNIFTITSSQDNCKFQISYWLVDSPIRIIQSGFSYPLSLNNSLSAYFIYYHHANQTFRLFESIKQGYVYSYATPVKSSLQETFNAGKYLFGGQSIYDGIQIGPSDANYCFKCYYLIKVVGAPNVDGSIGIADSFTRIQMREDEVIREKVNAGGSRYYSHPPQKFKLKANIVYGAVKVVITDSADGLYFQETLKTDREFDIAPRNSSAGFVFNLSIIQTATYTLQIIEGNKTRLIEGYPMACKFIANQPLTFSFSHTVGKSFNLLLMIDQDKFEYPSVIVLVTSAQSNKTFQSSSHVGNIYSFDIAGDATDYTLKIVVNSTIRMKVLVARNKLTYLQDSTPFLSRDNTIYQVFTAGHPIMLELFSCRGDVKLTASAKYPELLQATDNSISLSHSNLGGHYVISSVSREKEFYALVQSHSMQPPLYTISYTSVKAVPYKYFDTVQRNIEYKIDHNALEIKFEVPALVDKNKTFKNMKAEFKLIIADQGGDFNALTQCEMGLPLMQQSFPIPSFPPSETSAYKHTIPKDQLQKLFKKTLQTFYLGVVMKIKYDEGLQTRKLTYIYETLEVPIAFTNQVNIQTENSLSFIFFWIVVPIIIGGTIAWLSFGYCLRKLKMMRTGDNELIEEQSEVEIQGKSNNQIQSHHHSSKE